MASEIRGSDNFDSGRVGGVIQVATVQTRTQGTYSAPTTGDGTEITPLTITMTPTASGNKVILDWIVNGECYHEAGYIVTRNGVQLTDTTNGTNDRWAVITAQPYDGDSNSTPDNAVIRIIDNSSLATSSIYRLHIRASHSTARTLYLNRPVASIGNQYETSLSTGSAMEVAS
jgi:hypothetical protein